jgi:Xaa-Pro aminopeptidase
LPGAAAADDAIDGPAAVKTDDEIAYAREATRIAEAGHRHLLDIVEPGVSEDELAVDLKWHSKVARRRGQFPAVVRRSA